jgi:hypothetical protein
VRTSAYCLSIVEGGSYSLVNARQQLAHKRCGVSEAFARTDCLKDLLQFIAPGDDHPDTGACALAANAILMYKRRIDRFARKLLKYSSTSRSAAAFCIGTS